MRYFFILGCHRSGTTLLQQALNRHSRIVIPPETKFFSWFLGHSHACQLRRLQRLNNDLQIALPPPRVRIQGTRLAREFYGKMAHLYAARLGRTDGVLFGEKTPAHSGYVPRIRRHFPEAKLLWLYRDGRDVAHSMRRVPWLSQHLGVNMLIWMYYHRHQRRLAREGSAPVLFLKYEDLVRHPVRELARVTDFLEVPFEEEVALGSGNREGVLDWERDWKGRAFEPITPGRVGIWREELRPDEVRLLEALGGRALEDLGYPLATRPGSSWRGLLNPRLLRDALLFFRATRWDEAANQLFGRAFCFG